MTREFDDSGFVDVPGIFALNVFTEDKMKRYVDASHIVIYEVS